MPKTPKIPIPPSDAAKTASLPPYKLGSRSCGACHQRKVRCDRGEPCANCLRYDVDCVYPEKHTAETQKSSTLQDLSDRLQRVEVLLTRIAEGNVGVTSISDQHTPEYRSRKTNKTGNGADIVGSLSAGKGSKRSTWELLLNKSDVEPLLQDESIGLEGSGSTSQPKTPPQHATHTPNEASTSLVKDTALLDHYPNPQLALQLWETYVKSVDPVVKILHIPTIQSTVIATILNPESAHPSTLALTYAIYYAAVTALCHMEDKSIQLPSEKLALLQRYQHALDRLLLTSNLMSWPSMTDLQALAIYATCLRAHQLGRKVWVLTGLTIRLAQSIGVHQDDDSLSLSPFETEMRLRLWWHLCVLDSRAPEDQGFQTTVDLCNQQPRLPLNVNDNQLYPDMPHLPTESKQWTEMSFFLIQTESCRKILPFLDTQQRNATYSLTDVREKRKLIQDPFQHLSEKYGFSIESQRGTGSLQDIAIRHVITACKKMDFILQLQEDICLRKQSEKRKEKAPHTSKSSVQLACDALESSDLLLSRGFTRQFQWFFNMYTQWYALVYVLRSLNIINKGCGMEDSRAWGLADECFSRTSYLTGDCSVSLHDEQEHGRIWKLVNLLRRQVALKRQDTEPCAQNNGQVYGSNGVSAPQLSETNDAGATGFLEWDDASMFMNAPEEAFSLLMPEMPFLPDWNAVINDQ